MDRSVGGDMLNVSSHIYFSCLEVGIGICKHSCPKVLPIDILIIKWLC